MIEMPKTVEEGGYFYVGDRDASYLWGTLADEKIRALIEEMARKRIIITIHEKGDRVSRSKMKSQKERVRGMPNGVMRVMAHSSYPNRINYAGFKGNDVGWDTYRFAMTGKEVGQAANQFLHTEFGIDTDWSGDTGRSITWD